MKTVFVREMRLNLKMLLIWSLVVGLMGFSCIMLYENMQGEMQSLSEAFSNMGAFSDAFGMSTLSIGTIEGFFATEVGTVHGLGGAMFAAILAIGILSKEEEGHSGEFLLSLPLSRSKVVAAKGLCVAVMTVAFTLICALLYVVGFAGLGESLPVGNFVTFMSRELLMNLEIAAICFAVSSLSGKNRMGLGIGITLILYFYDIIGRVIPSLKDSLFIGPFSYANASEIFSGADTPVAAIMLAAVLVVCGVAAGFVIYNRRDLAS